VVILPVLKMPELLPMLQHKTLHGNEAILEVVIIEAEIVAKAFEKNPVPPAPPSCLPNGEYADLEKVFL